MIDYIADYLETIRERRVYPNVHPGYLRNLTPDCAPVEPESWEHIMDDVENIVMPGVNLPTKRNANLSVVRINFDCFSFFILLDYTLAIATNARLFPRVEFVSVITGRHAGGRHQLFGIHVGKLKSACFPFNNDFSVVQTFFFFFFIAIKGQQPSLYGTGNRSDELAG